MPGLHNSLTSLWQALDELFESSVHECIKGDVADAQNEANDHLDPAGNLRGAQNSREASER